MTAPHLHIRRGRLARWPRLQAIAGWLRRLTSPSLRAVHRLRRDEAGRLLQPFPDTSPDRHPALFAFARDQLAHTAEPHILSFGCSTGDEPISLTRYLPQARIDAFEINPRSLAIARTKAVKAGADRIAYSLAGEPPRTGDYDAIFCMSVLRHGELDAQVPLSCARTLPFARFAETVAAFDKILKPGGLLFVWGSNFRFGQTAQGRSYQPLVVPGAKSHRGPVYGPDDQLIDCEGNSVFVFRKPR